MLTVDEITRTNLEKFGFQHICTQGIKSSYLVDSRILINNSTIWTLNRPLNGSHLDKLFKAMDDEYKKTGTVTVYSTISVFYNIHKNSLSIFDGQHRVSALSDMMDKYNCTFSIIVDVYKNSTSETSEQIKNFLKTNDVLGQDVEYRPTIKKESLICMIQSEFNKLRKIRIKETKSNRPYLYIKDLTDFIQTTPKLQNLSHEDIIKLLKQINDKMSKMSMQELFKAEWRKSPKVCLSMFEKAEKLGFFLALRQKNKHRLDWNDLI
jgi:hypothetical protein